MKMKLTSIVGAILLTIVPSHGVTLIDTGAGGNTTIGSPLIFNSISSDGFFQNLAGQFTINTNFSIDSVEGWMSISVPGELNVVLYDDNLGLPGTSLFTETFTSGSDPAAHWETFTGLNWDLNAGTYWVAFEPTADSSFSATALNGAPQPLDSYAFESDGNNAWFTDSSTWGLRVNEVPEPSSVSFLFLALGTLVSIRRRKLG